MKSVAIIGAGPAGLVAAQKFLQSQQFSITIFEKTTEIGGSWAPGSIINPEMRTNQSKFTMGFSDFSWESVHFDGGQSAPVYPKASQVLRYITAYYEKFISPHNVVQFRTTVKGVERITAKEGFHESRYKLHLQEYSEDGEEKDSEKTFDYVVAAPGIYNIPKQLPYDLRDDALRASKVPLLHSTQYRTLNDIKLPTVVPPSGKRRVLVVGGSHSGGDIASLLALQLSDAQFSPHSTNESRHTWEDVEVVHISSHEMFAIPEFTRDLNASSCTFQPVDFTLFNRSSRPADPPPSFTVGLVTPDKVKALRKMVHTLVDGNEGDVKEQENDQLAPIGVMDDMYLQFLKAGKIVQLRGTLQKLSSDDSDTVTATVESTVTSSTNVVENVCAVIQATGFEVISSLSILSAEMKAALDFNASCSPAPIILDSNFLTKNSSLPTFAMIGFPGAFWGLFEMQARAIVQEWTPGTAELKTKAQSEQQEKLTEYYRELRDAVREKRKAEIPQNPFGDGIGALEQASRDLHLERFDLGFDETSGFVCSARYIDVGSTKLEALKTLTEVQSIRRRARSEGLFLARAVFHGLGGDWVAAGKDSNGTVQVIQWSFQPRFPSDPSFDWEYLSIRTAGSNTLRQVYRYREATDQITVWTALEDGFCTGSFVGTFNFNHDKQERGKDTAVAVLMEPEVGAQDSGNLSGYRFLFAGTTLKTWTVGNLGTNMTSPFELNLVRVGKV
jgi:hypothetical protein